MSKFVPPCGAGGSRKIMQVATMFGQMPLQQEPATPGTVSDEKRCNLHSSDATKLILGGATSLGPLVVRSTDGFQEHERKGDAESGFERDELAS